ncbi:hypothetical protein Tco_0700982 [Tanacetum coccineum]
MLEVVTALAAEEEHSTSPHSRAASSARDAQGTPTQSAAQASISTAQDTAGTQGTAQAQDTDEVQGTDNSQGTANLQGTAASQGTAAIPKSPNDYTPTDASQTSGGDEGLLDLYALNREVRRLKKQTLSQAKQIHKLKAKLKKLSKFVQPVVKHHAFWVESTLSEEHYVQDDYTADPFFEDIVDKDAAVTPDLERKSDETEEINVEEKKASDVKSGDMKNLDLRSLGDYEMIEEVARKIQDEWEKWQKKKEKKMKELYDKVQESIKDSFKDFIPMDSEREKQMLKERDEKRLLRKRKATISEEQPSKKRNLRTRKQLMT